MIGQNTVHSVSTGVDLLRGQNFEYLRLHTTLRPFAIQSTCGIHNLGNKVLRLGQGLDR
jgi:hypothetical protein